MTTLLRADLALTMDAALGVVHEPELAIDGGRIRALRSRRDSTAGPGPRDGGFPEDAWVLDLAGHWLLPGFVNAHTHAAMALLRGYADDLPLQTWLDERIWPAERHLTDEDVYAGTLLACAEMLTGGVTTFADMYLHMDAAAEAVAAAGLRAVLAPGLFGIVGDPPRSLAQAADFVRRWDGAQAGRIRARLGPHAPYTCPPEFLAEIAAAARDLGAGTHIHLGETRGELDDTKARWGRTPVQVAADAGLFDVGCVAAHCVWLEPGDAQLLAGDGVGVAHNPRSNARHGSGVAPVGDLLAAGVTVGLGTDSAASSGQLTLLEEMRAAALLAKASHEDPTALPARTLVELATIGGARALGLGEEVGSLTTGKRADVLALRIDRAGTTPVHDPWSVVAASAQDRGVAWVLCDGRPVAQDGRTLTVDAGTVREQAVTQAADLVRRARG